MSLSTVDCVAKVLLAAALCTPGAAISTQQEIWQAQPEVLRLSGTAGLLPISNLTGQLVSTAAAHCRGKLLTMFPSSSVMVFQI
jgi:hypothetical protein